MTGTVTLSPDPGFWVPPISSLSPLFKFISLSVCHTEPSGSFKSESSTWGKDEPASTGPSRLHSNVKASWFPHIPFLQEVSPLVCFFQMVSLGVRGYKTLIRLYKSAFFIGHVCSIVETDGSSLLVTKPGTGEGAAEETCPKRLGQPFPGSYGQCHCLQLTASFRTPIDNKQPGLGL